MIRPTLKEAMAMLSELKPYMTGLAVDNQYTVFALELIGSPSKAPSAHIRYLEEQSGIQAAAMLEFERRARQIGIRVIDVQLEPPAKE